MAFDTKQWLTDLKFTPEEVTALLPQFEAKAPDLEKGQLRLADYTRFAGENNTLKTSLDAKDAQLTQEMAEWAAIKNKDSEEATTLKSQLEETRTEAFQLRERLTNLAVEQGLDPEKVVPKKGGDPAPKKDPVAPTTVDLDPLRQQMGGITDYLLTLNAELPSIAQEHFDLTGERLDTRAFVAGIKDDLKKSKTDNLDPRSRWERQFEIPAKREAKSQKDRETDLKAAEDRGYERARSEAAIPGQSAPGRHAPVFTKISADGQGAKSKVLRPQPNANTRSFAQSLASGKYRTPISGSAVK